MNDQKEETTPPAEGGEAAPPEGGEAKPPEGGDTPPAEGGDDGDQDVEIDPPAEGGDTPPEGGDTPPAEGGDTPPEGGDKPKGVTKKSTLLPGGAFLVGDCHKKKRGGRKKKCSFIIAPHLVQ